MIFSNSVIRRYTPPTCTLEILGKPSPLSLWANRDLLNDVRFKLHFDDPKLNEDEQVTIQGDRSDLQLLCDIVTTYVQNLLQASPVCLTSKPEEFVTPSSEHLETSTGLAIAIKPNNLDLDKPGTIPLLKPQSLFTHELYFGDLSTDKEQTKIILNVSQLFDLVNALDEYTMEAEGLPNLKAPKRRKGIFLGLTAAVLFLGVGITAIGIKIFYLNHQQVALQKPESKSPKSTIQDILPPVPTPPSNFKVPSPILSSSAAQQKTLTPPANVNPLASPSRNPSVVTLIPPQAVLPPTQAVPPAPQRTTIVLTPQSPQSSVPPAITTLPYPKPANPSPIISGSLGSIGQKTTIPTLPSLPPLSSNSSLSESGQREGVAPSASKDTLGEDSGNKAVTSPLLDTIPQVGEVRQYFQQKWQPPGNLNQTLEYRLVLNSDGSLGRITPLGRAAKIYLDRTSMPLLGEPFVSAPPDGIKDPQIRLVLSPDGKVKTFLED